MTSKRRTFITRAEKIVPSESVFISQNGQFSHDATLSTQPYISKECGHTQKRLFVTTADSNRRTRTPSLPEPFNVRGMPRGGDINSAGMFPYFPIDYIHWIMLLLLYMEIISCRLEWRSFSFHWLIPPFSKIGRDGQAESSLEDYKYLIKYLKLEIAEDKHFGFPWILVTLLSCYFNST